MDEGAVAQRLGRLDDLLGRLESTSGPTVDGAMEAIGLLTEIYGEALARIMDRVAGMPGMADALTADELVGHLLVLHQVHPRPIDDRVHRALDDLRAAGAEVLLEGISGGVARVRLSGTGQGCGAPGVTDETVRDTVLAGAPELSDVEVTIAREDRPGPVPVELSAKRLAVARPTTARAGGS